MTDTALLLSRLALSAKIAAKVTLTEDLGERVVQKCAALLALAQEGNDELRKAAVSAVLDRNAKRLARLVEDANRTANHRDKAAKRLTDIKEQDFLDAPAGRIDRLMNRSLSIFERIQNLLESELLELDGISDEIEEALGKKNRSKGN